jgi:flagellar biogenesis protein FliO
MLLGLWIVVRGVARGRVISSSSRRLVTVLESTALSQHTAVHVVKAGNRYLLVGGGNNGSLATLTELPAEDVDAWLAAQRQISPASSFMETVRSIRWRP